MVDLIVRLNNLFQFVVEGRPDPGYETEVWTRASSHFIVFGEIIICAFSAGVIVLDFSLYLLFVGGRGYEEASSGVLSTSRIKRLYPKFLSPPKIEGSRSPRKSI